MSTLTIRFTGISCFLDARGPQDKFVKRVLLPVDNHVHDADRNNDGPHIPYIEFDILDRPQVHGDFLARKTYPRDGVSYHRFQLSGDRITVTNTVQPNPARLNILSTYDERVPKMALVTRDKFKVPEPEYFDDHPDSKKVAAYFDIQYGDLHAGPVSQRSTVFSGDTAWPERRLAASVELQVKIRDGEGPKILIESFNGNGFGQRTIELDPMTACITIGNQLQADIETNGSMLSPENFRAHYALCYDLFKNVPASAPRPENGATIRNGCIGSQYP